MAIEAIFGQRVKSDGYDGHIKLTRFSVSC